MKYILFIIVLLLSFTGCKKSDSKKNANASEECKALEAIYTAYNKYYACLDKNNLFTNPEYPEDNISHKQITQIIKHTKQTTECFVDFKKTHNEFPTKITEQMTYFYHYYNLFEGNIQLSPPQQRIKTKEELERVLKPHPFYLCIHKKIETNKPTAESTTENTQNPSSIEDINLATKQCTKELGDKEYQESKKKFKCD